MYVQLKTDGAVKNPVEGRASFEKKKKNGIWVCVGDKRGRLQFQFLLYCITFIPKLNFNLLLNGPSPMRKPDSVKHVISRETGKLN